MTVDEMAVAIVNGISSDPCDYCYYGERFAYYCPGNRCFNLEDNEIVQNWLESEAEEE